MAFGPAPSVSGDVRVKALEVIVAQLQERVTKLESSAANPAYKAPRPAARGPQPTGECFTEFEGGERIPRVAPRSMLLDPDGNVIIRADKDVYKDPPRWKGESFASKKFSQCPADYLRDLASFAVWKAGKDHEQKTLTAQGKPRWTFALWEASYAAGWAKLIEEYGAHDQTADVKPDPFAASPTNVEPAAEDDIPF